MISGGERGSRTEWEVVLALGARAVLTNGGVQHARHVDLRLQQQAVSADEIDTIVACFPDMQGRIVGKRFQAGYFLADTRRQ